MTRKVYYKSDLCLNTLEEKIKHKFLKKHCMYIMTSLDKIYVAFW